MKKNLSHYPNEFQNKILSLHKWQDQQMSLLGRMLLFRGIKEHFQLSYSEDDIKYSSHNKPYFQDGKIGFNISHSGDLVVCALTSLGEIGIDVEFMKETEIDKFKSLMTDNEWKRVHGSLNRIGSFYEYWTEKEAVIKLHGDGLSIPLGSFEIMGKKTHIQGEHFFLKEIKLYEGYACHIASSRRIPDQMIQVIEYSSALFS